VKIRRAAVRMDRKMLMFFPAKIGEARPGVKDC
jgi:hypothetical protein